ncbi:unnamed protein product [Ectocarpus sp. 12 AP-2014]
MCTNRCPPHNPALCLRSPSVLEKHVGDLKVLSDLRENKYCIERIRLLRSMVARLRIRCLRVEKTRVHQTISTQSQSAQHLATLVSYCNGRLCKRKKNCEKASKLRPFWKAERLHPLRGAENTRITHC